MKGIAQKGDFDGANDEKHRETICDFGELTLYIQSSDKPFIPLTPCSCHLHATDKYLLTFSQSNQRRSLFASRRKLPPFENGWASMHQQQI